MASIIIKLNRYDKIYQEHEQVTGVVVLEATSSVSHNGILLSASGSVRPQFARNSSGLFESFQSNKRLVNILHEEVLIAEPGKLPSGHTEIPFAFDVLPVEGKQLFETYHGVNINVNYFISCEIARPALFKNIRSEQEFHVEVPATVQFQPTPKEFTIEPTSLENVFKDKVDRIPPFRLSGVLHQTKCALGQPFTGYIKVEESEAVISSVDLQLVRVESIPNGQETLREATEIQNLQLGDGDVPRNLEIPIYMILPRLFSCPTTKTPDFQIEFEVNILAKFEDHYVITENFPISLYR